MSGRGAFEGVRIVDFTSYFTGPYATSLLADQGAEVIKVEASPVGDLMRQFGTARDGHAATYETVNHSKRSLCVNLKDPGAQQAVRQLIATADVMVENFRPGVAERLGVDYESCRSLSPQIVYLSISGYGDQGPYGGMPAFDTVIQAHAGYATIQGGEASPAFMRQAIVDKVTALYAAQALSAALYARATQGEGEHITLSMYDAALSFAWPDSYGEFTFVDGEVDLRPPISSMYNVQETKDGHIAISAVTNAQFRGFCRAVGRADALDDPRLAELSGRTAARDLMRGISVCTRNFTTEELCVRLLAEDVPHGPVRRREEVVCDPQFAHACVRTYGEDGHRTRMAIAPVRGGRLEARPPTAAPAAGQHSLEILRELGLAEALIVDLLEGGAVLQVNP